MNLRSIFDFFLDKPDTPESEIKMIERTRPIYKWDENKFNLRDSPKSNPDGRFCPDCEDEAGSFWAGPQGGLSQNIQCANKKCSSFFNHCFNLERIHWVEIDCKSYKKHILFCPYIIKNWSLIDLDPGENFYSRDNENEIKKLLKEKAEWCNKNCKGYWSVKSKKFYFQLEEDSIHFGMKWL